MHPPRRGDSEADVIIEAARRYATDLWFCEPARRDTARSALPLALDVDRTNCRT